jgi:hypothetical protein
MKEESEVLEVGLTAGQIIAAVKKKKKAEREYFIENLLAATSPEYIGTIREAREDGKAGRTKSI